MTTKQDGGPVFAPMGAPDPDDATKATYGMSLRDWFAGLAMASHIRNAGEHYHESPEEFVACRADTARRSYAIADAMLAERDK